MRWIIFELSEIAHAALGVPSSHFLTPDHETHKIPRSSYVCAKFDNFSSVFRKTVYAFQRYALLFVLL